MRLVKSLFIVSVLAAMTLWMFPGASAVGTPDDGDSLLALQQGKGKGKGKAKGKGKGKGQGQYPPAPKGKGKGKGKGKQAACDNTSNPPFCSASGFNEGEPVDVTATGPQGGGTASGFMVATVQIPAMAAQQRVWYQATERADDSGVVETAIELPGDAPSGTYEATFEGQDSGVVVSDTFQWDAASGPPSGLARAGDYLTNGFLLGLGLLLLGTTAVYGTRRWRGARAGP